MFTSRKFDNFENNLENNLNNPMAVRVYFLTQRRRDAETAEGIIYKISLRPQRLSASALK